MKSEIILCTGGARSGKSEFAEKLALSHTGAKGYVATSQIFDEEMQDRISKHRARRGEEWRTFEVPFSLSTHWDEIQNSCDIVLIDCLTMYVTNSFFSHGDVESQEDANEREAAILEDLKQFVSRVQNTEGKTIIFVTNELGFGIVPDNPLTRFFRDIAGRCNQYIASQSDKVYLTISGITIDLTAQEVSIHG